MGMRRLQEEEVEGGADEVSDVEVGDDIEVIEGDIGGES